MTVPLPEDRMPEAEVSLLLAFYLLEHPDSSGLAEVAIDGAQVMVGENRIFPIADFLSGRGWTQVEQRGRNDWQGSYEKDRQRLEVHAIPGVGDVVGSVGSTRVRAECKGGPLVRSRAGRERPILQGVLGQLLTVERVEDDDLMVAAVPHTPLFKRLADVWRDRTLVATSRIEIALVDRDDGIVGLSL